MQETPGLTPEIRSLAKFILASKGDPAHDIHMYWFRVGAWYADALALVVLTLPDDDPTLAEILNSMRSQTLYEDEIIAKNVLRYDMAREEAKHFVDKVGGEPMLLHARALVQGAVLKSESPRASLARKWRAALSNPLWWLLLGAVGGALIFL